jgi:hypothetical protein
MKQSDLGKSLDPTREVTVDKRLQLMDNWRSVYVCRYRHFVILRRVSLERISIQTTQI